MLMLKWSDHLDAYRLTSWLFLSPRTYKTHYMQSVNPALCGGVFFTSYLILISALIHFSEVHKAAEGEWWWTCLPSRPGWSDEREHKYMPTRGGEQKGKM